MVNEKELAAVRRYPLTLHVAELLGKTGKYGELFEHEHLAELLEREYPSPEYYSDMADVKAILIEQYRKCAESVEGKGYRIVNPNEHPKAALRPIKRGVKQLVKGHTIIRNAPYELLTDAERAENALALTRSGRMLHACIKELPQLEGRKNSNRMTTDVPRLPLKVE